MAQDLLRILASEGVELSDDVGDADILIVHFDGLRFGGHHVIVAIGVDAQG